ncbi:MAG: serine/threonine protein kinase [Symploca sp. SIO2B6]|nr:serine/threonine protein kinase [Symploca sp. SIO2B6]
MISTYVPKDRRKRGVILTPQGLQKLNLAKCNAEFENNHGNRYTLEAMSERTGLAINTLSKVFAAETRVDKQTIKGCFRAFNLALESSDYFCPQPEIQELELSDTKHPAQEKESKLEFPEGQVPLDSTFYVERPPIESECYQTISQPGALLRIKAPRLMGKTSLMAKIFHQATKLNYRTVSLSFRLADREIFQDLNKFLRWLCANVALELKLSNRLEDYWDEFFGSKVSCKIYFEHYLLEATTKPLVLALDDIDRLFSYPELANDFFGLLRTWHEQGKYREIWKKLRLVVVHSNAVHTPLSIHQSPFNVGVPVELQPFTDEQVLELAKRHQLNWSTEQAKQLMAIVGGNPYLVRLALYHLQHRNLTLEQLLPLLLSSKGIYSDHLQRQLWSLKQQPKLAAAFSKVITASTAVELDLVQAFKLQSMGLVNLQGNQATSSCRLYTQYFSSLFGSGSL